MSKNYGPYQNDVTTHKHKDTLQKTTTLILHGNKWVTLNPRPRSNSLFLNVPSISWMVLPRNKTFKGAFLPLVHIYWGRGTWTDSRGPNRPFSGAPFYFKFETLWVCANYYAYLTLLNLTQWGPPSLTSWGSLPLTWFLSLTSWGPLSLSQGGPLPKPVIFENLK